MAEAPEPDPIDLAVLDMAQRVMSDYDSARYQVAHRWSDAAGMWFTEIEPVGSKAVNISLYHGGDTLNVYFGSTWFECFSFDFDDLPDIEAVLQALCAGDFEQAGTRERSFARIYVSGHTWRVGHVHWPWPWGWRRTKRYPAYVR